ncbi:carbohydrate ABC transporter permease [Liquorilactobacillus ghanensis]|jgi:multiple sugar transport system permease protein|uniref:carbohydrate ABC transporter permease n=1 Tax=Liquorilactobacillus ghanensis TaxID=399370 RepID=UPI0039ECD57B
MDKQKISRLLEYLILIFGGILMLIPFLWMLDTALKSGSEAMTIPPVIIPKKLQWMNFVLAWHAAPFLRYFINSVIVTVITTCGQLLTTILAAYAFAKLEFYGKKIVFMICLTTMMVPGEMLIIPNFITLSKFHMINTYYALIIPWLASFFAVFTLRQTFMSIPDEIYYSAKIDGASDWYFLWHMLVPLAKPTIIALAALEIINSWNSFMWPLIVTNSDKMRTLPVGLSNFTTDAGTQFQLLMAASTIIIIPMLLVYIFLQKYIIAGVSRSGLKG